MDSAIVYKLDTELAISAMYGENWWFAYHEASKETDGQGNQKLRTSHQSSVAVTGP